MSNPVTFTTSGTVQAQDGTYLTRAADEELFQLCRQGEYAYILTSRQMGKSSLMVATAERLQNEGIQTAIVDLQRLGAQTTDANSWYLGVLTVLARKLRILPQLMTWWEENAGLGVAQRFLQFIEDLVLPRVAERLVVFIDEIDSTLSLDFTDDFFIALRYCFTARAENAGFRKLSFVLIGVATPSELIRDPQRTPFNIGRLVELDDFKFHELLPLIPALHSRKKQGKDVLRLVFNWTNGHPYLTQRICKEIKESGKTNWNRKSLKEIIYTTFFSENSEKDHNLQFIRDLILKRSINQDKVLEIYRYIRKGRLVLDEAQSIEKKYLKLSGLVKREGEKLLVRNKIYFQYFNETWIANNTELFIRIPRKLFIANSAGVFLAVLLLRFLGIFQLVDLRIYDFYHQISPDLGADSRIVVIGITESDLQLYGWPLSDQTVADLLNTIQRHGPKVIGLEIYRNFPHEPGSEQLAEQLGNSNVVAIMNVGSRTQEDQVPPPPTVPWERVGFNDLVIDPDGSLRRSLLFVNATEKPFFSFSLRVAAHYADHAGSVLSTDEKHLVLGEGTIPKLRGGEGGYHNIDARGYQTLLRYRSSSSPGQTLTAQQLLTGDFEEELLRDKVVLVGEVASSIRYELETPYNRNPETDSMPGIFIHGQIVSHLLDISEGENVVLKSFPDWIEIFLLACFSLVSTFVSWRILPLKFLILYLATVISIAYSASLILFVYSSLWTPVSYSISAVLLAVFLGGSNNFVYRYRRLEKRNLN